MKRVSTNFAPDNPGRFLWPGINRLTYMRRQRFKINRWQKIDQTNKLVFPWYAFEALDALKTWDVKTWSVFEYGGGYSTLWWRDKAKLVVSVDNSKIWSEKMKLIHVDDQDTYIQYPLTYTKRNAMLFDCIVIDGQPINWRDACMTYALQSVKKGGVIIIDNWKQDSIKGLGTHDWVETTRILKEKGLVYQTYCTPSHRDWKTIVIHV